MRCMVFHSAEDAEAASQRPSVQQLFAACAGLEVDGRMLLVWCDVSRFFEARVDPVLSAVSRATIVVSKPVERGELDPVLSLPMFVDSYGDVVDAGGIAVEQPDFDEVVRRANDHPDLCDQVEVETARAEAAEIALRELRGDDQAWTLRDILAKLVEAADVLLDEHDYDGHGYEEVIHARGLARARLGKAGGGP